MIADYQESDDDGLLLYFSLNLRSLRCICSNFSLCYWPNYIWFLLT